MGGESREESLFGVCWVLVSFIKNNASAKMVDFFTGIF